MCPQIYILNGYTNTTEDISGGDYVFVTCNHGYTLIGSPVVHCGLNGMYTSLPSCQGEIVSHFCKISFYYHHGFFRFIDVEFNLQNVYIWGKIVDTLANKYRLYSCICNSEKNLYLQRHCTDIMCCVKYDSIRAWRLSLPASYIYILVSFCYRQGTNKPFICDCFSRFL